MWVVDFIYLQMFFFFLGPSRFTPSSIAAKPMLSARTPPASRSLMMEPRLLHEEVRCALHQQWCCSRGGNAAIPPLTIPNLGVIMSDPDHKAALFQKNKDLFFALKSK